MIFPVLHGMYGEDGTIQGLFELAKIPYVGCGVLASAVSMDKLYTKIIVDHLGIRQAKFVGIHAYELEEIDKALDKVEEMLPYPVFVKPSKAGSSQGVNQAKDREELQAALLEAAKHDTKILVEETIKGREIECAVLGGKDVKASDVGEIKAADTFYTYEAKYNNPDSKDRYSSGTARRSIGKGERRCCCNFQSGRWLWTFQSGFLPGTWYK